jgi:hypothetical protein
MHPQEPQTGIMFYSRVGDINPHLSRQDTKMAFSKIIEQLRNTTQDKRDGNGADGSPAVVNLNPIERGLLEEEVIEALRTVYDPEIPVNIYDMGLIYEIEINNKGFVEIKMTLTSPGCPVAGDSPARCPAQGIQGRGRHRS